MNTICIMCPMGCSLEVNQTPEGVTVVGNTCKRGEVYGKQELICPERIVTSLVNVEGGGVLSVKTSALVNKTLIFDILKELKGATVKAPVKVGQVIIENVAESGADIVATAEL